MFKSTALFRSFSVLTLALAGTAAHAATCTPINRLPYAITQSGSYCLTADLSVDTPYERAAISISGSYVDLDFQGHTITNTTSVAAYGSFGVGLVFPGSYLSNVTVHNGTLSGFFSGISMSNWMGNENQISNLTVDSMTVSGSTFVGIGLAGLDNRITNNTVTSTVGVYQAAGIASSGSETVKATNRTVIQGNLIANTRATDITASFSAVGILVSEVADILIRDNTVTNTWIKSAGANVGSYGIRVSQTFGMRGNLNAITGGLIIQDNTVINSPLLTRLGNPNSVGVLIEFPADHAIVIGSKITSMTTGIETEIDHLWDSTRPVLQIDNSIISATTPVKGAGVVTLSN